MSILDTQEDLQWLHEVHGVDVEGVVLAILYGNEDCPERVDTYVHDDYRDAPTVWVRNELTMKLELRTSGIPAQS